MPSSHVSFGVTSDVTGQNVHGTFTLSFSFGHITVQATCLMVSTVTGGLHASTGGKIVESTLNNERPGEGTILDAYDYATSARPDSYSFGTKSGPDVPGPNQCAYVGGQQDLMQGNITIRQGS
jgi:hypothetical protein